MKKISDKHNIYFQSLGTTKQTKTVILSGPSYTSEDQVLMLEPGRIIVIGSIKDPLEELIKEFGRPELNRMTKTDIRPAGVFSQTAYKGLRQYIFGSIDDSPRSWNKEV